MLKLDKKWSKNNLKIIIGQILPIILKLIKIGQKILKLANQIGKNLTAIFEFSKIDRENIIKQSKTFEKNCPKVIPSGSIDFSATLSEIWLDTYWHRVPYITRINFKFFRPKNKGKKVVPSKFVFQIELTYNVQ